MRGGVADHQIRPRVSGVYSDLPSIQASKVFAAMRHIFFYRLTNGRETRPRKADDDVDIVKADDRNVFRQVLAGFLVKLVP